MNVPGGNIDKGKLDQRKVHGEFLTLDDMRQMELVSRDGKTIRLGDVAVVEDGHKNITSMARLDGRDAVGLSIIKTNDGNTVSIAEGVELALPSIKATLPEGMELSVRNRQRCTNRQGDQGYADKYSSRSYAHGDPCFISSRGNSRTTLIAALVIPSSIVSGMFWPTYPVLIDMMDADSHSHGAWHTYRKRDRRHRGNRILRRERILSMRRYWVPRR